MHETPSQEIFDTMKKVAIEIWQTYDNTYGYVDKKINKINSIENYADNAMVFYRMFDYINQAKFINKVNSEILTYINDNK